MHPGLLATAKLPFNLQKLIRMCIKPTIHESIQVMGRSLAPNADFIARLYNEIKRLHKEDG